MQLDNVEQNASEANDAVKSGNTNLESVSPIFDFLIFFSQVYKNYLPVQAIEYQNKARKKMFIICLIIVVIAGVILVPTLVHSWSHPNS